MAEEEKKYQLALHGTAIDRAINQINLYIPERYAKGTVDGTPVSEGELGFNDNAQYYSLQAKGYANEAKGYIEGDVSGVVRWDIAQSLSDANKEQARANIGAISKPTELQTTLVASSWSDNIYSFEASYPVAFYNLEMSLDSTATEEQTDAYASAKMTGVFNHNQIKALGDVPTVDIPIVLKVTKL